MQYIATCATVQFSSTYMYTFPLEHAFCFAIFDTLGCYRFPFSFICGRLLINKNTHARAMDPGDRKSLYTFELCVLIYILLHRLTESK